MAILEQRPKSQAKFLTANNTLTSGITKPAATANIPIVTVYRQFGDANTHTYWTYFETNSLVKGVTNADLAHGEHLFTFPLGHIMPLGGSVEYTGLCTTGTAIAADIGLGSVIASGAAAVLSGTATFEDFMLGTTTTATGYTAATTIANVTVSNAPRAIASKVIGSAVLDGSVTAKKIHLNHATNFDASENFTFSAKGWFGWRWLGLGLGTGPGL